MIRVAAQVLMGLMLLFGALTLIPKGIIYMKLKRRGKGSMYIGLGGLCAVFSAVAFYYAVSVVIEGL